MRILIAGMGAIGSMLVGYLSKNNDVYCLGRKWHIDKIRDRGYLLLRKVSQSIEEKIHVSKLYTSASEIAREEFDCVFLCVKAYDLENILNELVTQYVNSPWFVFIQNGLGIEDIARKILKETNIIRAITNNGANIPEPGVVNHAGVGETYIGGVYGDKKDYYARLVSDMLNEAGLPAKYVDNIKPYLFLKLGVNAAINPLTAILGIKNKGIIELQWLKPIIRKLCEEIVELARKNGVELVNLEKIILDVANKTRENTSSMLQDILKGKRTEIDYINGAIIKLGGKMNIKTPFNELIYYLVKAIEEEMKSPKEH